MASHRAQVDLADAWAKLAGAATRPGVFGKWPLNTLGGVPGAIVAEWAEMTADPEQSEDER